MHVYDVNLPNLLKILTFCVVVAAVDICHTVPQCNWGPPGLDTNPEIPHIQPL